MMVINALGKASCIIFGMVAAAAPYPGPPLQRPNPELANSHSQSLNPIFNETNQNSSNLSLTLDHLDFRIYDTPMTIQFYGIRTPLPETLIRTCIKQASNVCTARRIGGQGDVPLGTLAYTYSAGTAPDVVHLALVPRPQLTWSNWARLLSGISFVQGYLEYRELQFTLLWERSPGDVRVDGVGRIWGGLGATE